MGLNDYEMEAQPSTSDQNGKGGKIKLKGHGMVEEQEYDAEYVEKFVKGNKVIDESMVNIDASLKTPISNRDQSKIKSAKSKLNCFFRCGNNGKKLEVNETERLVIFRIGRIHPKGCKGPGIIKIYPEIDTKYETISISEQMVELTSLETITSDMKSISVKPIFFYEVLDPVKALINVTDYKQATILLCASIMRDAVGSHTFLELKNNKPKVQAMMKNRIAGATLAWGIRVRLIDFRDIRFIMEVEYKIPNNNVYFEKTVITGPGAAIVNVPQPQVQFVSNQAITMPKKSAAIKQRGSSDSDNDD